MPVTMTAASMRREATKPSASDSFCRRTTGNTATAVATHAMALMVSSRQAMPIRVSSPAPRM